MDGAVEQGHHETAAVITPPSETCARIRHLRGDEGKLYTEFVWVLA